MSFLILFYRYIARDLLGKPIRTLLTLSGVALGVGVVVAVHLSNDRAIGSFTDSLTIMSGQADYQINANGLPLGEELMGDLAWFWKYGAISAVVEGRAALPGPGARTGASTESVRVFGVDLLAEGPFRSYIAEDGENITPQVTAREFVALLVDPRQVVLPASLAGRLGVQKDSPLKLLIGEREEEFVVGAVLSDVETAQAFGGNVLFMDIAAAQLAFSKIGKVDRIDLVFHPGVERGPLLNRIRGHLPATAILHSPQELVRRSDKMLSAFRYNLTALSYLALIVGIILVYNTLNLSVVRRQTEIAALRALGTGRKTILAMFFMESVLLGLIGAGAGIGLGRLLSGGADALISRTVEALYTGVAVNPFRSGGGWRFNLVMLSLGAGLGAFSGLFPALRATNRAPVALLRQGFLTTARDRRFVGHALAGLALAVAGVGFALAPALGGFPVLGYVAALCLIAGASLLAPICARCLLSLLERASRRRLPVEMTLAVQSVQGGLARVIVAVISLMIATAMLVSIATMVGSFRQTVVAWVNQTLLADLYVKAAGAGAGDWGSPIEESTVEALRAIEGVAEVGGFRGRTIDYQGGLVTLGGGDFDSLARRGSLLLVDGRPTAPTVQSMIGKNQVIVSEPFSNKYGVHRGDRIQLPAGDRMETFLVEAVYYDYSSDRGIVVMDRDTYRRIYHDSDVTSLSLYLEPGASAEAVRRAIASNLPESRLAIFANIDLKKEALRVFDQTFKITYALEVIAILVAALGIVNTMATLLVQRQGEIALLRFLGASRRQIRRMTLVESALVGLLGVVIGAGLGLGLSLILIYVINRQSFGWTIQFDLPALFLAWSLLVVLLTTLASGLYPARAAVGVDPIRSLRAE